MRYYLRKFLLFIALAFMGIMPVFFVLNRSVPLTKTLQIYVFFFLLLTSAAIIGGLLGRLRDQTLGGALIGVLLWFLALCFYNSINTAIH